MMTLLKSKRTITQESRFVSVKHKTEDEPLFFSSSLLHSEAMLERNILGNSVRSPCGQRRSSALAPFPLLWRSTSSAKVRAPFTRISYNSTDEVVVDGRWREGWWVGLQVYD